MKRFDLLKESLMATLVTLMITFGVSFIPFKFDFIKGIKQGFLGFDIYDLYYTGNHTNNTKIDTNIVIVEIGDERATIADQITLLQKYSPALIAIDEVFDRPGDTSGNPNLRTAIKLSDNIIFSNRFNIDSGSEKGSFSKNFFETNDSHYVSGYINFIGTEFSVIRSYPPFLKENDSVYLAFTSAVVQKAFPESFRELKQRNNDLEIINYRGNLESFISISKEQLQYYEATDQLKNILPDKIILMGFFVKNHPFVLDDLHFSPLNKQVAGKSFPDIYGVVIHANILSMIITGDYIKQASELFSYLFAGIVIFLFLLFILSRYQKSTHPGHGWFLVIQFLLIMLMLYLFLQIFTYLHIKVSLLPIMIGLVLCVELLGVYKMIALWLNKKFQYKTVFKNSHIV